MLKRNINSPKWLVEEFLYNSSLAGWKRTVHLELDKLKTSTERVVIKSESTSNPREDISDKDIFPDSRLRNLQDRVEFRSNWTIPKCRDCDKSVENIFHPFGIVYCEVSKIDWETNLKIIKDPIRIHFRKVGII